MITVVDMRKAISIIDSHITLPEFIKHIGVMELNSIRDGYKGLCPFHTERMPSFTISKFNDVWRYYCFGCHKKGDIVTFVKEMYMLDGADAVAYIAEQCGIDISDAVRELTSAEKILRRKYDAMNLVAEWAWERLIGDRGLAYEYVIGRGISNDVIDEFKIGYSLNVNELLSFISSHKFGNMSDMEFDRTALWTNAIIFPVFASNGDVVAFYSRPITTTTHGPKYISTSGSHPFVSDREKSIYGLYQCRKSRLRHVDGLIMVEGQFDCLAAHTYGYDNCIALCGSKLTTSMINIINLNDVRTLSIVFDGDSAGVDAARGLSESGINTGLLDIKVGYIPQHGADPNSILITEPEIFKKAIGNTKALPVYYTDCVASDISDSAHISAHNSTIFIKTMARYVFSNRKADLPIVLKRMSELTGLTKEEIMDCMFIYSDEHTFTNIKAEMSIIKQMIEDTSNVIIPEVLLQLSHDDFAVSTNRRMYDLIATRHRDDKIISYDWLIGECKNIGIAYVESYLSENIRSAKIIEYKWCIEDILDKSRRRRTIDMSNTIMSRTADMSVPIVQTIEEMAGKISTLIFVGDHKSKSREEMVDEAEKLYNDRKNADTTLFGFPFGSRFPKGNYLIGGLEKGKALMLSAATGVGKTNLALNWVVDWTMSPLEGFDNAKVLYIPLEMDPRRLRFRIWSIHSGIGAGKIEKGLPLTEEEQYNLEFTKQLDRDKGPFIVKPREPTVSAVLYEINYHCAKYGIDIVVLDFIQRFSACELIGMRTDRTNIYEMASKILADRAQIRGDIAMIAISQSSDEAKKAGIEAEGGTAWAKHMPDYYDYSIILIRKTVQQIKNYGVQFGNRFIKYDKNRDGVDLVTEHAHLFNHQTPDGGGRYGNLQIGEISALRDMGLQEQIEIPGIMEGTVK